jgi:hypothetical protein
MQVMEFAEKQQRNAKKIKYYNETLYYQGTYEKDFLDHVSKIGIIEFVTRGPYIKYKFDNKIKAHYPDYYIQKYNLIV